MQVSERLVSIAVEGGATLACTLYLPPGDGPFATLLEALPYRMHDVTASYVDSYHRFATEGGFAVLRVDVRGTGNSTGIAHDEYPDIERRDLRTAIEWAAAQPWSNGKVGMFGTSYSGFNSLHMAMEGIPQLAAVAAMYATDDRYTDDVHYMGGVLRALDLIDYPLYMVAMNALPPTPAAFGDGWSAEWQRRLDLNEPWLLEWLRHPKPDATWRRGSVRTGPRGEGYQRVSCPVLLIAGWADGYRNNTFRTIEHMPGWQLIAGPWSHKDPSTAHPGPNIDCDRELIRFFDQHLRGGVPAMASRRRWPGTRVQVVASNCSCTSIHSPGTTGCCTAPGAPNGSLGHTPRWARSSMPRVMSVLVPSGATSHSFTDTWPTGADERTCSLTSLLASIISSSVCGQS